MAALNLSTNGASIAKSYQAIVDAPAPSGSSAASPTYGQWAVFSVTAPLVNAFQQGSGKESVLKVESTGEGELQDLIEDLSDGRIQFAFVKVKDPNTGLQKNALIGWCGEGVPERTKGYFSSHQAAVAKLLQGYHIQISARSDQDLTPDGIIQKVSDSSGAKYSVSEKPSKPTAAPPPLAKKPVFTPNVGGVSTSTYNPLTSRRVVQPASGSTDDDGWGDDAPPVTRTQLEKVASAYRPTKVDMNQLRGQEREALKATQQPTPDDSQDVVKGGYRPVGKVDIAAIRRQAAESGQLKDERPAPVKGSYEPVGKVDLAAIRARAQPPPPSSQTSAPTSASAALTNASSPADEASRSMPDRFATSATLGRLAELPKPKVSNRFGAGSSSFVGTKAPAPGQFGLQSSGPDTDSPPMGAGRSFASSAGKTPAQIWAEKKAAQGGDALSSPPAPAAPISAPLSSQLSGGWKSGYEGKKWATVQTSKTGASATSAENHESQQAEEEQEETGLSVPVGSLRDQYDRESPAQPPALDSENKPNISRPVALPGSLAQSKRKEEHVSAQPLPTPPPVQPRSPSPELATAEDEEAQSPVRIAVPIARSAEVSVQDAHDEQTSPPPTMPIRSLAQQVAPHSEEDTEADAGPDAARGVAEAAAANAFGDTAVVTANPGSAVGGKRATAQYDYEKAEDNELELREGDLVTNIEMVDTDWWMGQNPRGETGLFPSNYVEIVEDEANQTFHQAPVAAMPSSVEVGKTAVAQYDYEAAEDNELSFPEGAKITNIEFPDEDWWMGEYNGVQGLFPSNYVELNN